MDNPVLGLRTDIHVGRIHALKAEADEEGVDRHPYPVLELMARVYHELDDLNRDVSMSCSWNLRNRIVFERVHRQKELADVRLVELQTGRLVDMPQRRHVLRRSPAAFLLLQRLALACPPVDLDDRLATDELLKPSEVLYCYLGDIGIPALEESYQGVECSIIDSSSARRLLVSQLAAILHEVQNKLLRLLKLSLNSPYHLVDGHAFQLILVHAVGHIPHATHKVIHQINLGGTLDIPTPGHVLWSDADGRLYVPRLAVVSHSDPEKISAVSLLLMVEKDSLESYAHGQICKTDVKQMQCEYMRLSH